jgi:hypothetical protein
MAEEAGINTWWDSGGELREVFDHHLEAFARLVATDCMRIAKDHEYSFRPGERAHDAIGAKYGVKP